VKVLIVGAGGREHALAWKLAQSPLLDELHAAPGNPGIAELGKCHPVGGEDGESLLALARELGIELVVVGPEAPLVAGIADLLRRSGIAVFGPSAAAARLEGSKGFAKDVMRAAGVPTAATLAAARVPCVVKADGLAAGKGVWVCRTQPELDAGLRAAQALGQPFHVEELLEGEEVSVFALCDGTTVRPLAAAQDYKRIGDGDTGPNTGGMGSFSPSPHVADADVDELVELTCRPVLAELARRDAPFVGVLFAGLMLGADGPKVLEYNCRFGDPETQSILARFDGDLLPALHACATGDLRTAPVPAVAQAAVTIVLATRDYPERGESGTAIEGIAAAQVTGAVVFHAGTALRGGRLVTNGGRVLAVTAAGDSVADARARAYEAVGRISFDGMRYRRDIAELVHA
jgi:phosphoribosylamine--glycine ligase